MFVRTKKKKKTTFGVLHFLADQLAIFIRIKGAMNPKDKVWQAI